MKRMVMILLVLALLCIAGCQLPGFEMSVPTEPPRHEHQYDGGTVTEEPTHLENGLMSYTCVACGESFTDVIEKSGAHTWEFLSVDGEKHSQKCECGYTVSTDKHILKSGEITVEPSPDACGEQKMHCVLCNYETVRELLYVNDEENDKEGEDEIVSDQMIAIHSPESGSVAYDTLEDCKLLVGGYVINRIGEGALGVQMPIAEGALNKDEIYVLSFKGRAQSYRTATVELLSKDEEVLATYTYGLSVQYSEYSLPFKATATECLARITVDETEGESALGGVHISPAGVDSIQAADSGYSMLPDDSWQEIDVDYTGALVEGTTASRDVFVREDGYVIAIAKGLQIYKENGTEPILIYKEEGELTEARQMDFSDDGNTLFFVARSGGVFVYDITNIEQPERICHFDSLEMATGIDVLGDYLYIADRSFGVSIYDVSVPAQPKIVSLINSGETQDVTCYNGFVYCGVWAAQKVRIYDVRDIDNPTHVYDIPLSGRGDGVTLSGNLLYAATGHHEPDQSGKETPGYGIGNGMEIWDVANPYEPKRLSIVRCDGRTYVNSPDVWRITLVDRYAFLSCSYAGVYAFDVSDPSAPRRVAKINVRADNGTPGYKDLATRADFVFPYDTDEKKYAPIVDCDLAGGVLYLSAYLDGLYAVELTLTDATHRVEDTTVYPSHNDFAYFERDDFEAMGLHNPDVFAPGTQIWTVREHEGYLYVAAGIGGIYVLDTDMKVLSRTQTADACYDLSIVGNTIYTAESVSGVGIYYIDENDPTSITQHSVTRMTGSIVQLTLSPGAKFAFCHSSNSALLVDLRDPENLSIYESYSYSMFYQHQISFAAAANRYLWAYATSGMSIMLDFGENGEYDEPKKILWDECSIGFNSGGITVDGDYFLVGSSARFYIVDPSDESIYDVQFKKAGSYVYRSSQAIDGGAPTVIGNYLFVRNRINGTLTVYKWASDNHETMPKKLLSIDTSGSTTNPIMIGNRVYIPLGYEGLLAFDMPEA